MIILIVTLLILWKNDFCVKYKSADKLIDNFYDFYYSCRYENSLEDYEDYLENKNLFIKNISSSNILFVFVFDYKIVILCNKKINLKY